MITRLSDPDLLAFVAREIAADPEITSTSISVAAHAGVVTLTGCVPNYAERVAAERAALRVRDVRAVANDLLVKLVSLRGDPDIAADTARALEAHAGVPASVKATVRDGVVALEGTVEWMFQRLAAERAVSHLRGVTGVNNNIRIMPSRSMIEARRDTTERTTILIPMVRDHLVAIV